MKNHSNNCYLNSVLQVCGLANYVVRFVQNIRIQINFCCEVYSYVNTYEVWLVSQ